MSYKSANHEWLCAEIESEFGCEFDLSGFTTEEIQDLYDNLFGDMYNGIMIRD